MSERTYANLRDQVLVIAELSSHDLPLDAALIASTLRALSKLRPTLAG
jgi:hypothetical protein